MKIVKAKIEWLLSRKEIPSIVENKKRGDLTFAYTPIIVFEGQYNKPIWDKNVSTVPLWSSVIFNDEIKGQDSIATLTYLFESAPFDLLQQGAKFELYEGAKKVATGRIITNGEEEKL